MKASVSNYGQRISIVGTSGSGKTTLARQSQYLGIPHIELDALHWEPNWIEVPDDVMRDRVSQALSCRENWVVDGNYSQVRDIVWSQAKTVVWLDYSLPVIMSRLVRRTYQRLVTREQVCNGNRETWQKTFSRDSILLWALQTYSKKRKEYPMLLNKPEYAHLEVVHLHSPQATQDWLSRLKNECSDYS